MNFDNNLAFTKDSHTQSNQNDFDEDETLQRMQRTANQHRKLNESSKNSSSLFYRPKNLNIQDMGHHTTATVETKYNRFEQLLKNLVGRKVSREPIQINNNGDSKNSERRLDKSRMETPFATTTATTSPPPQSNNNNNSMNRNSGTTTSLSSNDSSAIDKNKYSGDEIHFISSSSNTSHFDDYPVDSHRMNTPLLVTSPEIKISRAPSAHSLYRNENKFFNTTSTASTTSLNASMHQRLWSVVPLLRREGSCTSLNQQNAVKPLIHQRSDIGLKKCETVSTLTHSQTTSNFEPIKPKNRLRHSPSIATCSRCSSILSLAANGSRYSLNIANGGFVAIKNDLSEYRNILQIIIQYQCLCILYYSYTKFNFNARLKT